ncbi:MAG: MerR family transcriptional regulator [Candidatus Komeilibacteria bacterium]
MPYLKIGQLAKKVGCLPSTIHFYTQEGLLQEDSRTQGGYRLYDEKKAIQMIKKIASLQSKNRFRISEIRNIIKK